MILSKYKQQKNISEEDKQIDKEYAAWCETNGRYDHLTDKQIYERYKKNYLCQQ